MTKMINQCGKNTKNKSLIITAWIFCFLTFAVNAQSTNPKLQVPDNAYLSKGLTVTNVVADDGKLELKITIFNHTPKAVKAVVEVYAFSYGYYPIDIKGNPGNGAFDPKYLKYYEKELQGKSPQELIDEIPLSSRIKPPFEFSLEAENMAWWKDITEIEFRPNASRDIIYRRIPAQFVLNTNAPTKMFYPQSKFVRRKEDAFGTPMYCYTPMSLTTFDLSSFYVVVDDNFRDPKRLNSTFFLDRWTEYDKKKANSSK